MTHIVDNLQIAATERKFLDQGDLEILDWLMTDFSKQHCDGNLTVNEYEDLINELHYPDDITDRLEVKYAFNRGSTTEQIREILDRLFIPSDFLDDPEMYRYTRMASGEASPKKQKTDEELDNSAEPPQDDTTSTNSTDSSDTETTVTAIEDDDEPMDEDHITTCEYWMHVKPSNTTLQGKDLDLEEGWIEKLGPFRLPYDRRQKYLKGNGTKEMIWRYSGGLERQSYPEKAPKSFCKLTPEGMRPITHFDKIIRNLMMKPCYCFWCNEETHDTQQCDAYRNWLRDILPVTTLVQGEPERMWPQEDVNSIVHEMDDAYPWQFHVGLEDGSYVLEDGTFLQVRQQKLINVAPAPCVIDGIDYSEIPNGKLMFTVRKIGDIVKYSMSAVEKRMEERFRTITQDVHNMAESMDGHIRDVILDEDSRRSTALTEIVEVLKTEHTRLSRRVEDLEQDLEKRERVSNYIYRLEKSAQPDQASLMWTGVYPGGLPTYKAMPKWKRFILHFNAITAHNLYNLHNSQYIDHRVRQVAWNKEVEADIYQLSELTKTVFRDLVENSTAVCDEKIPEKQYFIAFCDLLAYNVQRLAITPNQVYDFAVHILYSTQCHPERIQDKQLASLIGCFSTGWKNHSSKCDIIRYHLPGVSHFLHNKLLHWILSADNHNCVCHEHKNDPIQGPSPWILMKVPPYDYVIKKCTNEGILVHQGKTYVQTIKHHLLTRLHMYYTPYMPLLAPELGRHCQSNSFRFSQEESDYLRMEIMRQHPMWGFKKVTRSLELLEDLKEAYCPCGPHSFSRRFKSARELFGNMRHQHLRSELFIDISSDSSSDDESVPDLIDLAEHAANTTVSLDAITQAKTTSVAEDSLAEAVGAAQLPDPVNAESADDTVIRETRDSPQSPDPESVMEAYPEAVPATNTNNDSADNDDNAHTVDCNDDSNNAADDHTDEITTETKSSSLEDLD